MGCSEVIGEGSNSCRSVSQLIPVTFGEANVCLGVTACQKECENNAWHHLFGPEEECFGRVLRESLLDFQRK